MDAVLHYRDGHTERVRVAPIEPHDDNVTIRGDNPRTVPLADLKAVFYQSQGQPTEAPQGSDIAVEFADGETIRGVAQYNPDQNGFYLFPTDRSRNDRIFVVTSAIFSIDIARL